MLNDHVSYNNQMRLLCYYMNMQYNILCYNKIMLLMPNYGQIFLVFSWLFKPLVGHNLLFLLLNTLSFARCSTKIMLILVLYILIL